MSDEATAGLNVSVSFVFDLMCACAMRRVKRLGWTEDEARLAVETLAEDLKAAIPDLLTDELASAAAGLQAAGGLTDERLTVALVSLTAIRAIEIADKHNRRRVAQRN